MFVTHIFPYSMRAPGGHSNAIREFINCQKQAGINVKAISPLNNEVFNPDLGISDETTELDYNDENALASFIRSVSCKPDSIIHIHSIDKNSTAIARLAHQLKIPLSFTSHGQLNYKNTLHAILKYGYLKLRDNPIRYATGIHLLTQKEIRKARFILPKFSGIIDQIPHIVKIPLDKPNNTRNENQFIITFIGRLDIHTKGLDLLLKGFKKANIDDSKLIIAGPDWNNGRRQLMDMVSELSLTGRVEIIGPVYENQKDKLLIETDLFVAPSRWDAFNITVVEAMARKVPVLVSENMNISQELREHNAAAICACSPRSIAKSLCLLASNKDLLQTIDNNGFKWAAEKCNPISVGRKFLDFYGKILASSNRK